MTYVSITLTDPVSGLSVQIWPADGVAAQVLDVSAPARAVAEDRVNAPGSYDVTQFTGAAAVSLSLLLYPGVTQTPEKFWDSLAPLLSPALRPYLIAANDQWAGPRQLTVRYDSTSKPFSDPTNWPVQISWSAPAGAWEAAAPVTVTATAFVASTSGFVIDVPGIVVTSAGYVFPPTSSGGTLQVTSPGTMQSQWSALLYGPATGPKLANDAAGLTLEFTGGLSLNAGDYVAIDSASRTALLNSDPSQNVIGSLNFTTSTWWLMQPGQNLLRYYPSTAGAGAVAQVSFRPAWMA